jgi:hypothetical protein
MRYLLTKILKYIGIALGSMLVLVGISVAGFYVIFNLAIKSKTDFLTSPTPYIVAGII